MQFNSKVESYEWVTNAFGDRYIADMHQGFFDKNSSESVFDKYYWNSLQEINSGCIIFFGSDSGLIYKYLVERFSDKKVICLVFDIDYVVDAIPPEENVNNVKLLKFSDLKLLTTTYSLNQFIFLDELYTFRSLSVLEDCLGIYGESTRIAEGFVQDYKYSIVSVLGYKTFHKSNLMNIPFLEKPFSSLKKIYDNEKALIVAGGPSLDNVIENIKQLKESYTVFAVARVVSILIKQGIIPDYVVTVDPTELSYFNSVSSLDISDQSTLICSNHAHPKLVGQWKGDVFYLGQKFPWNVDFDTENETGAGPTVTNTTIKSAIFMGFKEIVLAGVDLCHNANGFTHAKGSAEADNGPYTKIDTLFVKNYAGEEVETTIDFYSALNSLKLQAIGAKNQGVKIINISEKSAAIDYIDFVTPESLINNASKKKIKQTSVTEVNLLEKMEKSYEEVKSKKELSDYIIDEIKKSKAIELDVISNDVLDKSVLRRIKNLELILSDIPESFDKFIKLFGLKEFYRGDAVKNIEDLDGEELNNYNKKYFEAFYTVLCEINTLLNVVLKRFEIRRMELGGIDNSDLDLIKTILVEQSLSLRIHKIDFDRSNLNDELHLERVKNELIDCFEKDKKEAIQKDMKRVERRDHGVELILKSHSFFINKSLDPLMNIINYAESKGIDLVLINYMKGLQSELNEDLASALNFYQYVIESGTEDNVVLKYSLERVFSIYSKVDDKMALSAIECLSLLSPYYIKHHAEALLATGNVLESLDRFADYHTFFPNDVSNLIRIAEVYAMIDHKSKAIELLESVKLEHPNRLDVKAALRTIQYS